ncbi:unnamed protein product [Linum tenue]|uniref:RING-type E3 ubiquitin transferase n=1 Tax=Linum tenue TaxID=586396 RepID=A0AAV0HU27_9ROSI|nr:unnamed protein product [Linum tenue]
MAITNYSPVFFFPPLKQRILFSSGEGKQSLQLIPISRLKNDYFYVSRQRNVQSQALEDKKLGGAAREAKERLDERLRTQRKWSDSKRRAVKSGTLRIVDARTMSPLGELQTEVWGAKSSRWERLKMMKWKAAATKTAAEQEECTICLDLFRAGDHLVHLPCAHRFHSKCLLPWLVTNAHCPCCRMEIHVEIPS